MTDGEGSFHVLFFFDTVHLLTDIDTISQFVYNHTYMYCVCMHITEFCHAAKVSKVGWMGVGLKFWKKVD